VVSGPTSLSESLSPVDAKGLQLLLKGPLAGARSVALLSCAGALRAGVFPYSIINTLGALDKRRAAEQVDFLRARASKLKAVTAPPPDDFTVAKALSLLLLSLSPRTSPVLTTKRSWPFTPRLLAAPIPCCASLA
jgi:hypothetical protein